ncbi:MAG: OsmC family protein [Candidatus Sericytochromatia bacterium]
MSVATAKLIWPPSKDKIQPIDTSWEPQGNAHLLNVKGASFYANPSSTYGGDDSQLNPEDLLASSISSCFFMTFFAIANKAKIGLKSYESNVEVHVGGEKVKSAEKIVFNLKMDCESNPEKDKLMELCQKAHKYCIIANSVKAELEFVLN